MKTITSWIEEYVCDRDRTDDGPNACLDDFFQRIRGEALEEAEKIARRDDHKETADKIHALGSLP